MHDLSQVAVIYTTYSTSLLTISTILLGYILGEKFPVKTYVIFCFVGAALFCATGGLLTKQSVQQRNPVFHPSDQNLQMLTASACLSFLNAIAKAVDGGLTILKCDEF